MWVLIGYGIIIASVLGGFMLSGGHLAALIQPLEFLTIAGSAAGALVVGNGQKVTMATVKAIPALLKPAKVTKELQVELLSMLYELLMKVRRDGLLGIESDIDEPHQSAVFQKYPNVLAQHHLIDFITDYLHLMVSGQMNTVEMEALMDQEIDTHHEEGMLPINAVTKMGDALPGFGIVAAVMGVVHTMESVGLPPEELGMLIARALVGTFLGILLAYGFVGPLAQLMELRLNDETRLFQAIKVTLLATANAYAPITAVEYGRKVLYSGDRLSFSELEQHMRGLK